MRLNRLFKKELKESGNSDDKSVWVTPAPQDSASPEEANIITSVVAEVGDTKYHNVLLDLDVQHHYVKSSTDGHAHLYINTVLEHEQYRELLQVLQKCGILGEGTASQIDRDGCTSLRLPGVKKGINDGPKLSGYCVYCHNGKPHLGIYCGTGAGDGTGVVPSF